MLFSSYTAIRDPRTHTHHNLDAALLVFVKWHVLLLTHFQRRHMTVINLMHVADQIERMRSIVNTPHVNMRFSRDASSNDMLSRFSDVIHLVIIKMAGVDYVPQ